MERPALRVISIPKNSVIIIDDPLMRTRIQMALGLGFGIIVYELIKHGSLQIDWVRPVFVSAISFVLFLLLPRRWPEKDPKS
jgi:hypothetical protein